jgi:RimJ/RimL family protein N-acetyltransferase
MDKIYFLVGKYCKLGKLSKSDLNDSEWLKSINNPEYCKNLLSLGYYPVSFDDEVKYIENQKNNELRLAIYNNDDKMIGIVSLNNISYLHRSCNHSQIIFKTCQNYEVFYESNKLIFDHGFNNLNMNRISGGSVDILQVEMMCKFFNFKIEGEQRQSQFKDGKYLNNYLISLLKEDYSL